MKTETNFWYRIIKESYPDSYEELIYSLAAAIQKKPLTAIVVTGSMGCGKDFMLAPIFEHFNRRAKIVSGRKALMSSYNDFLDSDVLLIEEFNPTKAAKEAVSVLFRQCKNAIPIKKKGKVVPERIFCDPAFFMTTNVTELGEMPNWFEVYSSRIDHRRFHEIAAEFGIDNTYHWAVDGFPEVIDHLLGLDVKVYNDSFDIFGVKKT